MLMLQEILGYVFIGFFGMVVCAILYLPVYFIVRRKIPFWRQAAFFLFIVCLLVILSATVFDAVIMSILSGDRILAAEHHLNLVPLRCYTDAWLMGERKQYTQILANVLMFVPLGFIVPVVFKNTRQLWKTAIYMALFSFSIEFTQYFIGRSADIDDLILNTAGGVLGYLVFLSFSKLLRDKKLWKKLNGTALQDKA